MKIRFLVQVLLAMLCTRATSQSISIKDIAFRDGFEFVAYDDDHMEVAYRIDLKKTPQSVFRRIRFDTLLTVTDTTLIKLFGDYKLLRAAANNHFSVMIFEDFAASKLAFISIDNTTGQQQSKVLPLDARSTTSEFLLTRTNIPNLFCLAVVKTNGKEMNVYGISSDGEIRWIKYLPDPQQSFTITKFGSHYEHIYFVKTKKFGRPKESNELILLSSATGDLVQSAPFNSEDLKRSVDQVHQLDSATLLITGFNYYHKKMKGPSSFYADKLNLRTLQTQGKETLSPNISQSSFIGMDFLSSPGYGDFVVGEGFRSNTSGEHFARVFFSSVFTLGFAYLNYTKLVFNNMVVIPVEPREMAARHRPIEFAASPRSVILGGGYYKPAAMARHARLTGQVRYLGKDKRGGFYFQDNGKLKYLSMAMPQPVELGILPEAESQLVVFTSPKYLVFYNQRKSRNLVEFKIFPVNR